MPLPPINWEGMPAEDVAREREARILLDAAERIARENPMGPLVEASLSPEELAQLKAAYMTVHDQKHINDIAYRGLPRSMSGPSPEKRRRLRAKRKAAKRA
jgi:hypothetical protein